MPFLWGPHAHSCGSPNPAAACVCDSGDMTCAMLGRRGEYPSVQGTGKPSSSVRPDRVWGGRGAPPSLSVSPDWVWGQGRMSCQEQPGRGRETQAKRLHSGGDKVSRCLAVQLSLARRFYSSVSVKNKKMWPPFSYRYSNKSTNTLHEEFRGLHIESVFWSLSIKMSCSELKEKVLSELNRVGEIYFCTSHETWLQHVWNPPPGRKRRLTENTPRLMPSLWRLL